MAGVIGATRKGVVIDRAAPALQPAQKACPNIGGQFELNGPAGLLLNDDRARPNIGASYDISDFDFNQVAPSQLAVDREIEQRSVAVASFSFEKEANGPNLLLRERALRSDVLARIPSPRRKWVLSALNPLPNLFGEIVPVSCPASVPVAK
jgi:hypothetical protein